MKIATVIAIVLGVIIIVLLGVFIFAKPVQSPTTNATSTTPIASMYGLVQGSISLSPICPVESIPPNPQCAPKPYQTTIAISRDLQNSTAFETIQSDASGTFSVSLPAGEYDFYVQSNAVYRRCNGQVVTVSADEITAVAITCDTGIR